MTFVYSVIMENESALLNSAIYHGVQSQGEDTGA
jgi:hypothetical protein